jgi:5-methylcytosine-specific restriction endonuclease McrA
MKSRECKYCSELYDISNRTDRSEYCSPKCRAKYNSKKQQDKRSNDKVAMIEYIYKRYKASAKRRNLRFNLSKEYFINNVNAECHYCGEKIELVSFDRINSNNGYTEDNIVPCCKQCNTMKWDYTKKEFIEQCKRIIDNCIV